MPNQHINAHIAILGCVCLGLLAYLPHTQSPEPAAPVVTSVTGFSGDYSSPESLNVVVNKALPLGRPDYVPPLAPAGGVHLRPEAAAAFHSMAAEAAGAGVTLTAVSGYRSAEDQAGLHTSYTGRYGPVTADSISALAGHSEHQTGLAVDIGNPDGACALQACFEGTAAGSWAAANAHRHGFIIRYPAGAEAVTGYAYEPWHLRYVGAEMAGKLNDSGETLEEYTGLAGGL